MPIIKHIPIYSAPKKLLSYAANEKKSEKTLITGLNCSSNAADAYEEMKVNFEMYAHERFFKKSIKPETAKTEKRKIRLHHYIQSFKPNEVSAEEAHKIGIEWAEKVFGKNHMVLCATHTTESQFNILEITKPVDTGYVFSRTPLWNELIESASDDEPPTAPSNLHAESSTSTSIKISWNESEDKSGIYCYYIYRDGEQIGTSKSLYYVDNGLDSRSQHMYYVIAQDIDGNMSEKSNIIEAATDADEYAPTQPANLTAAVKSENTIYLSWIASSDNVKVVEYNVYRNGVLIAKTEGTAYTDKNAFAGAYTYYVEAVDDEGNVSTASNKVDVDNAAPSSPVLTVGKVTDEYISLEWAATDKVGVVLYGVYKDGVLIKTVTSNSYVDTNVNVDTEYTYYVIAYDAAENKSEASNKVTVNTGNDEIAPEITFLKSTEKVYSKTAKVSVSAENNRAVTKFIIQASSDKAVWTDVASVNAGGRANETAAADIDLTGHADGELYLRAYAEDAAGNSGNAEKSPVISITVDNTAPEVPYEVAVNTENSIIELGWNTAENSADTEYFRIYRRVNDESD